MNNERCEKVGCNFYDKLLGCTCDVSLLGFVCVLPLIDDFKKRANLIKEDLLALSIMPKDEKCLKLGCIHFSSYQCTCDKYSLEYVCPLPIIDLAIREVLAYEQ